jgi:hypothetical protein
MTRYTNVNAPDIENWGGKRTVESAARPGGGYRGRKVYASKSDARMDSHDFRDFDGRFVGIPSPPRLIQNYR